VGKIDLTTNLDDGRLILRELCDRETGERKIVPDGVDHGRIERHGKRMQSVQRPFVRLIEFSCRHKRRDLLHIEAQRRQQSAGSAQIPGTVQPHRRSLEGVYGQPHAARTAASIRPVSRSHPAAVLGRKAWCIRMPIRAIKTTIVAA
jgi:hypothetical protein